MKVIEDDYFEKESWMACILSTIVFSIVNDIKNI